MYKLDKIEIVHRVDQNGSEKSFGGYIKVKVEISGEAYGHEHHIVNPRIVYAIIKEEILDDFAMNVMAEVDGAKG